MPAEIAAVSVQNFYYLSCWLQPFWRSAFTINKFRGAPYNSDYCVRKQIQLTERLLEDKAGEHYERGSGKIRAGPRGLSQPCNVLGNDTDMPNSKMFFFPTPQSSQKAVKLPGHLSLPLPKGKNQPTNQRKYQFFKSQLGII